MRLLYFLRFSSDGLSDIVIYRKSDDPSEQNQGFAFLEFKSCLSAVNARRIIRRALIFEAKIPVDWAEPQDAPEEAAMSKVRVTVDVVQ